MKSSQANGTYEKIWEEADPLPPSLQAAFERIYKFLGMDGWWWDARVYNSENVPRQWRSTDMVTECRHGREAFFLVNNKLAEMDVNQRGRYVAASAIHEVLHVYFWVMDEAHEEAVEGAPGRALYELRHGEMIHKLAWTLIDHIFPNLDPEEDFFNEAGADGTIADLQCDQYCECEASGTGERCNHK